MNSNLPLPVLDPEAEKVFTALRVRKAMPVLEIAGVTGIYGPSLQNAIQRLAEKRLVTIKKEPAKLWEGIVSISGKYF